MADPIGAGDPAVERITAHSAELGPLEGDGDRVACPGVALRRRSELEEEQVGDECPCGSHLDVVAVANAGLLFSNERTLFNYLFVEKLFALPPGSRGANSS